MQQDIFNALHQLYQSLARANIHSSPAITLHPKDYYRLLDEIAGATLDPQRATDGSVKLLGFVITRGAEKKSAEDTAGAALNQAWPWLEMDNAALGGVRAVVEPLRDGGYLKEGE